MQTIIRILTLALLLTLSVFVQAEKPCPITVMDPSGKKIRVMAEIADDENERRTGLMFRRSLAENSGMLFVFPDNDYRNFWMKNTLIPLSIAYIGQSGTINEILDMKPMDISVTYPSTRPARCALEVPMGWFSRNGIRPGCRVIFHGCLGQ